MMNATSNDRLRIVAAQHEEAAEDMMLYERFAEASEHFERAADLLGQASDVDGQFRVLVALARALRLGGEDVRARQALVAAADAARRGERGVNYLRALAFIAQLDEDLGQSRDAEGHWAKIAEWTEIEPLEAALQPLRVKALGRLAEMALSRGEIDAASAHLDACEALILRIDDASALAAMLTTRARWLRLRGDDDGAEAALQKALAIHGEGRDLPKMASVLGQLGNLKRERGQLASARQLFQSSLTMAESASDALAAASALTNLANIAIVLDDPTTAARHYAEVIDIATACNHTETLLGALVNLGNLEASAGNAAMARARYAQSLEIAIELGAARLEVDIGMLIAQLDAKDGRLDAAETRIVAALQRAEAIRYHAAVARLRVNLAGLQQARGRLRDAAIGYKAGLDVFERLTRPMDAVAAGLALVDCLRYLGELSEAEATLTRLRPLVRDAEQREALDLRLAEARLALARAPGKATADLVLGLADKLDAARRPVEALGARLEVVDTCPDRADALQQVLSASAALTLDKPLQLERDSIAARQSGDETALEALVTDASGLGLPLLAIRIGRRRCEAAAAVGRVDAGLVELVRSATVLSYGAERARLEFLVPR